MSEQLKELGLIGVENAEFINNLIQKNASLEADNKRLTAIVIKLAEKL